MKKRVGLVVIIMLMCVGFAAISTTLIINGNAKVSENKQDFDIYFSKARLDTVDVYENVISQDKKTITFQTNNLSKIGDKSVLEYEVTNNSNNYDAEVKVTCTPESNKYTSLVNELDTEDNIVSSRNKANGTLTITLKKTSLEEVEEKYTCTLEFNAVERNTIGVAPINLYNMIKTNADTTTIIDYSVRSGTSGTNGIYTTTATEENVSVYYYRGNVDNNIIFNNMCWKIIRTTETGGIKLIYNGTPNDDKCDYTGGSSTTIGLSAWNTKGDDAAYVGYMFGINNVGNSSSKDQAQTNTYESTIKSFLENWYELNFDEATASKLEDTIFCNDRSVVDGNDNNVLGSNYGILGYGKNATGFGAVSRASLHTKEANPSLACAQDNDKFTVDSKNGNGKLKFPVGLITTDEAVLAGFNTHAGNTSDSLDKNNYLYIGYTYWTLSPIFMSTNGSVGTVSSTGAVNDDSVGQSYGVRPVISLKTETYIKPNGSGTTTNPYVVE